MQNLPLSDLLGAIEAWAVLQDRRPHLDPPASFYRAREEARDARAELERRLAEHSALRTRNVALEAEAAALRASSSEATASLPVAWEGIDSDEQALLEAALAILAGVDPERVVITAQEKEGRWVSVRCVIVHQNDPPSGVRHALRVIKVSALASSVDPRLRAWVNKELQGHTGTSEKKARMLFEKVRAIARASSYVSDPLSESADGLLSHLKDTFEPWKDPSPAPPPLHVVECLWIRDHWHYLDPATLPKESTDVLLTVVELYATRPPSPARTELYRLAREELLKRAKEPER